MLKIKHVSYNGDKEAVPNVHAQKKNWFHLNDVYKEAVKLKKDRRINGRFK